MKQDHGCKRLVWSSLFAAGVSLGWMPSTAQAAEPAEKSPLLTRVTAIVISTDPSSDGVLDLDAESITDLAVDFTYFLSPNIAVNLLATILAVEVQTKNPAIQAVAGSSSLGSIGLIPPILALQYHFSPGPTSFYVGAGVNFNIFHDETGDLQQLDVEVDDTIGYVAQVGVDLELTDNTVLNVDLKYLTFKTDVEVGFDNTGGLDDELELDAIILGFGLGWRL